MLRSGSLAVITLLFLALPVYGAVAVFDSEPNVMYLGTGSDGVRSN